MKGELNEEIKGIGISVVDILMQHFRDNFISLVLFGSWARGEGKNHSDVDFFAIIEGLPKSHFQRSTLLSSLLTPRIKRRVVLIAKTKEEFLSYLPSLYLDIALDAVILFDQGGFLEGALKRIKELVEEAGLEKVREKDRFFWKWKKPPNGGWELTWKGFRELP